jgi:hypothetical protein
MFGLKARIRSFFNRSEVGKKLYRLMHAARQVLSRRQSDSSFARKRFREAMGRELQLDEPVLFNDKLWWLKLNNRDPLLRTCTDKVTARAYVSDAGYESILVPWYGVYGSIDEFLSEPVKERCFLKMNNSSGHNVIWDPTRADAERRVKSTLKWAFKDDYYWKSREWNYLGIEPKIIAEKILPTSFLADYRFLCFHGEAKVLFIDIRLTEETGGHYLDGRRYVSRRNVYDLDFNRIDVTVLHENFPEELVPKPENFAEMIDIAETLARPFPFCRVDLYNMEGRIFFGEMTFYPTGGMGRIIPLGFEKEWGDYIDLNSPSVVLDK